MIRKSFQQRVKDRLIADGWNIQYTDIPFIDFFSVRRGAHMKNAYRVRPHGHLKKAEVAALREYGKSHKMHVIYTHEQEGHELRFERLYPMCEKWTKQT
jgi:hypothetical protein